MGLSHNTSYGSARYDLVKSLEARFAATGYECFAVRVVPRCTPTKFRTTKKKKGKNLTLFVSGDLRPQRRRAERPRPRGGVVVIARSGVAAASATASALRRLARLRDPPLPARRRPFLWRSPCGGG